MEAALRLCCFRPSSEARHGRQPDPEDEMSVGPASSRASSSRNSRTCCNSGQGDASEAPGHQENGPDAKTAVTAAAAAGGGSATVLLPQLCSRYEGRWTSTSSVENSSATAAAAAAEGKTRVEEENEKHNLAAHLPEGADPEPCGCDEEDPLAGNALMPVLERIHKEEELEEHVQGQPAAAPKVPPPCARCTSRLDELARPKPPPVAAVLPEALPKLVTREKKPRQIRPSLLLRLRPTNLEEAMECFFAGGCQEPPTFTYAYPNEDIAQLFEENNKVCFELLPDAKRIIQLVHDEYGGPVDFMNRLYGLEKVSAASHADIIHDYVKDLGLADKVNIRVVDGMLSAANVTIPAPDGKYVVNVSSGPVARSMVQGICDHEVGTHLLRMMNDELQVWHGARERYKLMNPWTTEEGFATLNTYQSMPCKLLFPQALRYLAVCRGAQIGFVELFHELAEHAPDPKLRWQMCCRIKRGLMDTSVPGAFYMDQAYFKGAVEILQHLEEVDFGRLYGGQIALQDLSKVVFLLRKEVVRLPKFLRSAEKLRLYKAYCRKLIQENQIAIASERICKPVFIRTARDFFGEKPKKKAKPRVMLPPVQRPKNSEQD